MIDIQTIESKIDEDLESYSDEQKLAILKCWKATFEKKINELLMKKTNLSDEE